MSLLKEKRVLSEKLLSFVQFGIDPVLWVLIAMSVIGVGVMIERALAYNGIEKNYKTMDEYVLRLLLEARLGIFVSPYPTTASKYWRRDPKKGLS